MPYRVGSLFTGIGGFDLGFERAGLDIAWQVENDRHCQSVLRQHWPNTKLYDNVITVKTSDLVPVEVITAGWPCQDHSIAGTRRGFDGARSSLFREFARILAELRPRWFVAENVPGLLSQHSTFKEVISTFDELGYLGCWRIFDAQYFGVAQRRKRLFFVGCLAASGGNPAAVLFESEGSDRNIATRQEARQGFAAPLGSGSNGRGWNSDTERNTFVPVQSDIARCLTGRGQRIDGESDTFIVSNTILARDTTSRSDGSDNLIIASVAAFDPVNVTSQANRTRVAFGLPANTLHSTGLSLIEKAKQFRVRRLLPIECERLQGFPDNWTAGQADLHRYAQIGNAICVPVAEWIARRLLKEIQRDVSQTTW